MSDSKVQKLYERLRALQEAARAGCPPVDYAVAALDRPVLKPGEEPAKPVVATNSHGIASVRYATECSAEGNSYSVAVAWLAGHASAADLGIALAGLDRVDSPKKNPTSSYAGDGGIAVTSCKFGVAWANNGGIAIAGSRSEAYAGVSGDSNHEWSRGIAVADTYGKAMVGPDGVIVIRDKKGVPHAGEIGKNGLKPNTLYQWDEDHGFVEAPAG